MTLFKIKSPFRYSKKAKDPTEETRAIAERLYRNRLVTKRPGDADSDWVKAERILKSPVRRSLFRLNQPLIRAEKGAVEPVANWVDRADLFRIIERLSPAIEALGVIAIPLVLFFAAQGYQESLRQQELEQLQQQAVTDYLNQLSAILLDLDGSLSDSQNIELRTLATATTLTLLRDPNLDAARKGQVIRFLSQMDLLHRKVVYGPQRPEEMIPIISLSTAPLSYTDLRHAYFSYTDLSHADLRYTYFHFAHLISANFENANLSSAHLSSANLSFANLLGANLIGADLISANLSSAQMSGANLIGADLISANLSSAQLSGANLNGADLLGANFYRTDIKEVNNLTQSQVENTYLCATKLPASINLDPDRDCGKEWERGQVIVYWDQWGNLRRKLLHKAKS